MSSSVAADDQMAKGVDRRDADLVAAADRERQAVPFEPAVGLEDDVGRRVVRIGVHRVGAVVGRAKSGSEGRVTSAIVSRNPHRTLRLCACRQRIERDGERR